MTKRLATGFAIVGLVLGAAGGTGSPAAAQKAVSGGGMQHRTAPLRCRAASERALDHVVLEVASGDAIVAEGGCTLVIRDSTIIAPSWGLVVQGGAEITIERSTIQGGAGSMSIEDGGEVTAQGSTFKGRVARRPEAKFTDQGGNQLP